MAQEIPSHEDTVMSDGPTRNATSGDADVTMSDNLSEPQSTSLDTQTSSQESDSTMKADPSAQLSSEMQISSAMPTSSVLPSSAHHKKDLEDLFDSEDEAADELLSSMPLPTTHTARYSDPEVLRAFYQRLLPFRYLFQWLNHAMVPTKDFMHREFAFTLSNDAYLRYQSFATADLLRKQCYTLVPSRFEIGPVYSTNPRDRKQLRKASMFRPLSKELVFDIDMTDYDPIRTCCSGANICNRCWAWITMAIKVIDVALKDDFGFKHILWVYSGRRGAHAWVCDKRARELDDTRRKAVAGYMELLKGGDKGGKKVNVRRPLHPHLERSLRILRDHFATDVLANQDPWQTDEKAQDLLRLLPDAPLAAALAKRWEAAPGRSSAAKWADIDKLAADGVSPKLDTKALMEAKQDIVLEYTYPRLDAEVSKKRNHLLKSPFVVHPGTGRVCVPIDVRRVEEFDPMGVPTVTELLGEIDAYAGPEVKTDWEKTRLRPYVEFFRAFVAGLVKEEMGREKRAREDGVDF